MPKKEPGLTLDELEKIDPSYVIRLKGGKRYPFTKALISVMWRYGVESIETEMIEHDPTAQRATHRAVITGSRGMYTAHGDCCPKSVSNRAVLPHYQRISETRAIGRALRWYLNLGETAFDELGEIEEDAQPKPAPKKRKRAAPKPTDRAALLEKQGYEMSVINALRRQRNKPEVNELSETDFQGMLEWLETDAAKNMIHAYYIAKEEGRRR